MTWVRLDDQFADHPKIVGLSANAFRLHVTAICYAARQETDGVIPRGASFVVAAKRCVGELTAAGVWETHPAGFVVHDYLEYNPSSASLRDKRAAESERKRRGIRPEVNDPVPDPYPTRIPDPDPPPNAGAGEDVFIRCTRAYDNLKGNAACTPTIQQLIGDWLSENQGVANLGDWFESACAKAAAADRKTLSYVLGILRREASEGRDAPRRSSPNGAAPRSERVNTGAGLVVNASMSDDLAETAALVEREKAAKRG